MSHPLSLDGGLFEIEDESPGCTIADVDAEPSEFQLTPASDSHSPASSQLDQAFAAATKVEIDFAPCDLHPPPPLYRPELDPKFWKLQRPEPKSVRPVINYGPYATSEIVVADALKWLAAHQQPDGGWSFAHKLSNCSADCQHEGTYQEDRAAATALVLLPFLGAGQSHKTGKYKKEVLAALYFLVKQMKLKQVDDVSYGSFPPDGIIPTQSLCTLALCESYAMTHDKGLMQPAQFSLNQLLREPAVLDDGFSWMAIRSGENAYLKVPPRQPHRGQLLRAILSDRSKHKFAAPARHPALVSVAALDRWFELKAAQDRESDFPLEGNVPPPREQPTPEQDADLQQFVKWLGDWGPQGDLDYQYFATQTLRHRGGDSWTDWHKKINEPLIKAQERNNHATGSWHFADDPRATGGGRLYCTALAAMILEVYYRHLPVYGE